MTKESKLEHLKCLTIHEVSDPLHFLTQLAEKHNALVDFIEEKFYWRIEYGCHIEAPDILPDCVMDYGDYGGCAYAKKGMKREECEYWRVVK